VRDIGYGGIEQLYSMESFGASERKLWASKRGREGKLEE